MFGPSAFCSNNNEEQFSTLQPALAVPEPPVALRKGELLSRTNVPDEDVNWKETKFSDVELNGELPSVSVSSPDAVPAHPRVHVPCQSKLLTPEAADKGKVASRRAANIAKIRLHIRAPKSSFHSPAAVEPTRCTQQKTARRRSRGIFGEGA
jgi:hypothetical protein